ncbi:MAG: hypothetical protein R2865_05400 [Deinococcales bacterium]
MYRLEAASDDIYMASRAVLEGDMSSAMGLLTRALDSWQRSSDQAKLKLYLAACYSFSGKDGLNQAGSLLTEAKRHDPFIVSSPLYGAMSALLAAYYQQKQEDTIIRILK